MSDGILAAPSPAPSPAPVAAPSPTPSPAPAAAPAAPDHSALISGIQARRAQRESARSAPTGAAALPKEAADKIARLDQYEASEKAKQDTAAKRLQPAARAVYDSISDLGARRAFLDFSAASTPPAPAIAPPGTGGGGGPPAQSTIDVLAMANEKGIDWVKANHADAYAKYAEGFGVGAKKTSMSSVFSKKKK